jgi:hypothetical protein
MPRSRALKNDGLTVGPRPAEVLPGGQVIDPANAHDLAEIARAIGAEVLAGDPRGPSETGDVATQRLFDGVAWRAKM